VKILVLVKYSLDVAEIRVEPSTHALRMTGVPERFGDLDKGALQAAVELGQTCDATVEVLCFGPPAARAALKDLLAIGADEATVIDDPYGGAADGAVVARVLEAAIEKRGPFDLIICGFASDDGYSHQTGPRLAERLGLPLVSYACRIGLDDGVLVAERDLEEGLESVSVRLPAIVSVAEEAFVARPVTLLQAMKAQKKPTNTWEMQADLGLDKDALTQSASRCSVLTTEGIVVERQGRVLKAMELSEMADRLVDWLVEEQVLVQPGGA
jgi:electron transfer flavoprotein beta subunit